MENFDDIDISDLSEEELDDIVGGQFGISLTCVL
jgi:hypothetical protein